LDKCGIIWEAAQQGEFVLISLRLEGKIAAVLRNRNYLLLWLGQLISSLGSSFNSVSLYFLLLKTSGSAGSLFGLFLLNAVVYLVCAPFTGALIDSWNRKRTMIVADLARAGLVLLIPFAAEIWQIYLISAFISFFTLIFDPARNAVLPRVLESRKELLFVGNSFMTTSTSIAETLGFFTGGVFVVSFGFAAAFYFDAATFVLSALCILALTVSTPAEEGSTRLRAMVADFGHKLKEGLGLVANSNQLRALFSYYFLFSLAFGAGNFLFPILVEDGYRLGADAFGYFSGTMTLGYLVGSFIVGPLGERYNRIHLFTAAVFGVGFCIVLLGFSSSFALMLPWAFIIGLFNPVTVVFSRAFIQEQIVEEQLGRAFSIFSLVMQVGMMSSLGLAFGLLQVFGIRQVVVVLGCLTILVAVVGPTITNLSRTTGCAEGTELPRTG